MENEEEDKYPESGCSKFARTVVMVFNIFLFVMGLGCLGVGMWMIADRYVYSYFIVLRREYSDRVLSAAPAILIVCGIFCIAMAIVGILGLSKRRRKFLLLYSIVLFVILVLELVVGFTCVVFRHQIHRYVKDGMKDSLQNYYEFDNTVGMAWNWIQVRHKCCGADGSWDYENSAWFVSNNEEASDGLVDATTFVPVTCCTLEANQDRDPSKVNPQEPIPRDLTRCQEDAMGKKVSGNYVHARGCFARLNDFINRHINTLICIGLIVGFLQLVGFIAACYLTCKLDKIEDDYVIEQQQFIQPKKA